MFFLILLLLIGIVGSFFVKGVDAKAMDLIRLILCLLLVAVSIGRCRGTQATSSTDLTMDRRWLVGWKMGETVAADLPDGGRVIVVQMNEISEMITAYNQSEREGFRKGAGDVEFALARVGAQESNSGNPMGVSGETIKEMVTEASNAVAVVSFVNLPLSRLARMKLPPTYVFDPMGSGYWKRALETGQVKAAIYPDLADGKAPPDKVTGNPTERFDEMYKLATRP